MTSFQRHVGVDPAPNRSPRAATASFFVEDLADPAATHGDARSLSGRPGDPASWPRTAGPGRAAGSAPGRDGPPPLGGRWPPVRTSCSALARGVERLSRPNPAPDGGQGVGEGRARLAAPGGRADGRAGAVVEACREQGDDREQREQAGRGARDGVVRPLTSGPDPEVVAHLPEGCGAALRTRHPASAGRTGARPAAGRGGSVQGRVLRVAAAPGARAAAPGGSATGGRRGATRPVAGQTSVARSRPPYHPGTAGPRRSQRAASPAGGPPARFGSRAPSVRGRARPGPGRRGGAGSYRAASRPRRVTQVTPPGRGPPGGSSAAVAAGSRIRSRRRSASSVAPVGSGGTTRRAGRSRPSTAARPGADGPGAQPRAHRRSRPGSGPRPGDPAAATALPASRAFGPPPAAPPSARLLRRTPGATLVRRHDQGRATPIPRGTRRLGRALK